MQAIFPKAVKYRNIGFLPRNIVTGPNSDSRWTIVAGQHGRKGRERASQVKRIIYFVIHDYSNTDIPRKDIAMVRLKNRIQFTKEIQPICLPSSKWDDPTPGTKCWIVGWGSYSKYRRKVTGSNPIRVGRNTWNMSVCFSA